MLDTKKTFGLTPFEVELMVVVSGLVGFGAGALFYTASTGSATGMAGFAAVWAVAAPTASLLLTWIARRTKPQR